MAVPLGLCSFQGRVGIHPSCSAQDAHRPPPPPLQDPAKMKDLQGGPRGLDNLLYRCVC